MNWNIENHSPEFLERRRPLIIEALDRFNAGIMLPKPKLPTLYYSRPASKRDMKASKSEATGCVPIGAEVVTGNHRGTVTAYLGPYANPNEYMPPRYPVTLQGGHTRHYPVVFPRYCVVVVLNGKRYFHFPKATTIERWWTGQAEILEAI